MALTLQMLNKWGKGTVILSPRDLTEDQIEKFATKIARANGSALVDPQLYDPRADHQRRVSHTYWPQQYSTIEFEKIPYLNNLLMQIKHLNDKAQAKEFIIPGTYCPKVSNQCLKIQEKIVERAVAIITDRARIATLCLSADVVRDEAQLEKIIDETKKRDIKKFLYCCRTP